MRIAKLEFGLVDSKDHHHEKLHGGVEGGLIGFRHQHQPQHMAMLWNQMPHLGVGDEHRTLHACSTAPHSGSQAVLVRASLLRGFCSLA